MRRTVKKAYELLESSPNVFMLQHFYNPETLSLLEPTERNKLNGGKSGPHQITGNGARFKPYILDMDLMEEHRHWKSSEGFPC
uniref:Uncharacterized protein n=1 Tax=Solanum lycopersicum TaxID=4081 RepID=A0A3Q7GY71_SOLLC